VISTNFKAAIFDYGGVMAKSPLGRVEMLADHFGAGKEMIMGLILGQNSADDNPWFDAECGHQPLNEDFGQRMQKIFNNHNLTFDLSYFRAWVADAVNEPDLGMERVVNQLKEDGIKVGLLTNSVPEFWPVIERTINTKLFDCIVDSSQVGVRKPDERIYELTARKLGMSTSSCVMIDDLHHNVKGAEKTGMAGILFTSSKETEEAIKNYFRI
jgi:epoxide hydrolase-like predicted phosphatase|tara:strand:- start:1869 stop:2507 length:639 start_codon:yes stop_codon:yes gene_type:complete